MNTDLKDILKGKVVIMGIGNPLKGDDGFGPALIAELQGKVSAVCIDAGTAPETYGGKAVKEDPDTILIVDAVHLARNAGEYELLVKDDILKTGMTTHDLSPRLFLDYLQSQTKADIYLLGLQPKHVSFGEDMSLPVKKALADIVTEIKEALNA